MKLTGVYEVRHIETNRVYVGQSVDIHRRITDHKRGGNGHLAKAISKYGWNSFEWRVLEICARDELNVVEVAWIAKLGCISPNGFNLTNGGGANSKVSKETREKISLAGKGRKPTKEAIAKRTASRLANPNGRGYKLSEETVRRRQETTRGRKGREWTPEQRAAKSLQMSGRKSSAETRKKLSEMRIGKPRSKETRAAISAGRIGMKFSEDHISKIKSAVSIRGDDWRKKISITKKRKNAERRDLIAAFGAQHDVVFGDERMAA